MTVALVVKTRDFKIPGKNVRFCAIKKVNRTGNNASLWLIPGAASGSSLFEWQGRSGRGTQAKGPDTEQKGTDYSLGYLDHKHKPLWVS